MSSIPYSRYLIYPIPWYSFLIVTGVVLALILACREEKRKKLPKDTVIDLALFLLPMGIIGARIYYVIFSWSQFSSDPLSVFRVWEGGLAIYGGVIGGFLAILLFSRRRRLPFLLLCDLIAPGLVLAQAIGRWGNWFNIEAYGLSVTDPSLCFFPFAVQVPSDGDTWHLATFFFESAWNLGVFLFLICFRRRKSCRTGDVFCFYLVLYAAGRLVIEELRTDSLYASSSIRVSQLLSVLLCLAILVRYAAVLRRAGVYSCRRLLLLMPSVAAVLFALFYALCGGRFAAWPVTTVILSLSLCSLVMIVTLFLFHHESQSVSEVSNADNQA